MPIIKIKEKLLQRISEIEDENLLNEVYDMVREDAEVYKISAPQKEAVERGLNDIKNGRTISHEDAGKDIDEWLKD